MHSYALGLATTNSYGKIIEAFYPCPAVSPAPDLAELISTTCGDSDHLRLDQKACQNLISALDELGYGAEARLLSDLAESEQPVLLCALAEDVPPQSIAGAFLKLHLLSHRLVKPHQVNLDGLFGTLLNLAWTNEGAITLEDLPQRQLAARLRGELLEVMSVDKFPKMTNYVVPSGVRIAHTARVRLGAYIGEGTTVMHEGFVNFNAGTDGAAMIEGRISAGVVVGANSDLGGAASTMGTLSGGGTQVISVGENCLLGANSGIGFPLANGCIVEAGLYVTAGTKVNLLDHNGELIKTCKALDLSELEHRLFRRNSLNGAVECVPIRTKVELNDALHSNN